MSAGNLEGKLVDHGFWPVCENCCFSKACQTKPRHPAYPHTWHWGREFVSFPEGELILRSWVGTSAIGQPHTGCQSYQADPQHISEPQEHHKRYLALERERQELDAKLNQWERQGALSPRAEALYMRQFKRYEEILEAQKAIRNEAAKPATVAKEGLERVAQADWERTLRAIQGLASGAYTVSLTAQNGEVSGTVTNGDGQAYSAAVTRSGLYRCSCPDYTYRRVICKHLVILAIHAIQQQEEIQQPKPSLKLARVRSFPE